MLSNFLFQAWPQQGDNPTYMLWESFEGGLIDPHNDVAHVDATALCSRLARKELFNPNHAGAVGFVGDALLPTETEAQPWCVLQQTHLKHVICADRDMSDCHISRLSSSEERVRCWNSKCTAGSIVVWHTVSSPGVTKLYSGFSLTSSGCSLFLLWSWSLSALGGVHWGVRGAWKLSVGRWPFCSNKCTVWGRQLIRSASVAS